MDILGKIKLIDTTKEVGTSGFKKRDIVVTTDETYPQHILVQFVQDKCDLLDAFKVGESVKIDINLRGREWTNPQGETSYFNTIQGWRIAKHTVQSPTEVYHSNHPTNIPSQNQSQPQPYNEEEPDDLPF